jgi:hypothetical protein
MTRHMVPEFFDSINVISADGEELGMVDSHVMGFVHVKSTAGSERIGAHNAVGYHLFLDGRQQGLCPCVEDIGGANLPAPLKQAEYGNFPECSSTSLSFASASEVTFICFDLPTQLATRKLACNETTKST